jgi:hypothetical protein
VQLLTLCIGLTLCVPPPHLSAGYLTKVKNLKIKAKSRHFRLTETTFAYYEANAEGLIAKVKKTDIIHVEDVVNTKHFRVRTAVGASALLPHAPLVSCKLCSFALSTTW